MKFLIPTAKEMTKTEPVASSAISQKTQAIIASMSQKTASELAKLYKISLTAAETEHQRWQALQAGATTYPALALFNGLMYRQMDRTASYLRERVLITSALYGVIPAAAPIAEHRLDFQQSLVVEGSRLKALWRSDYDAAVADQDTIVSLLSSEFEEVFSPAVRERFVTVLFQEDKAGQLKTHSTISKKGRGLFLNQASLENAQTLDDLRQLTFAGFAYRADLSSDRELVYVKPVD